MSTVDKDVPSIVKGVENCAKRIISVRDSLADTKEFVALVGAGFSCNAHSEFPLWSEISNWINEACKDELKGQNPSNALGREAEDDFTVAAEWYFYTLGTAGSKFDISSGKGSFAAAMNLKLGNLARDAKGNPSQLEAHRALIHTFDTIYTTNWDCLLETACEKNSIPYKKHFLHGNNVDLDVWKMETEASAESEIAAKQIVKYHGCCTDRTGYSIVASRTDYDNRIYRFNRIMKAGNCGKDDYDRKLADSIPCLFGYSYKDINIRFVLSQAHLTAGEKCAPRALNVVVDNPANFSKDRLNFFKEAYGIETLFLFDEEDKYHMERSRWEAALQFENYGGDKEFRERYKRVMTASSRSGFTELFDKVSSTT